ncbi:MAG: AzlD domain-containing protein [Roseovarius sp.]|nr:AzlD domain-containing protein [Roseovarius sp.]MCY4207530.1 AzlD domain-containing protein [Roseovarius sp.]MCY4290206.1 AzlD domain-containing protein [Roseovarius sp.]MCY4315602.1 AzlD domain-containing protein [Roseovarius sp.]
MIDKESIWTVMAGLALGSYVLRILFLGIVGNRPLPEWLARHLRYTAVSFIPALAVPLALWPAATGGEPDAARLLAATATVLTGLLLRSVIVSICAGAAVLYLVLHLTG